METNTNIISIGDDRLEMINIKEKAKKEYQPDIII